MATKKRFIDANNLKNEMLEENPYIHFGPFGYCACSPQTDGELVFKREDVLRAIDSAPTIDAVEVVHGQWLQGYPIHCSVCGGYAATEYEDVNTYEAWLSPYCPHCGAKMDVLPIHHGDHGHITKEEALKAIGV